MSKPLHALTAQLCVACGHRTTPTHPSRLRDYLGCVAAQDTEEHVGTATGALFRRRGASLVRQGELKILQQLQARANVIMLAAEQGFFLLFGSSRLQQVLPYLSQNAS